MKQILLFMLFIGIFSANAQNGKRKFNRENMPKEGILVGKILDAQTNKPVEYSNVVLYRMRDSSMVAGKVTDKNGEFAMRKLPYGKFYLVANFIGYNKKHVNKIVIFPKKKFVKLPDIKLTQSTKELNEVNIIADKQHVEYKIDKKVVNISQDLQSTGGSAVDALENTPSVSTDMEGNVTLRGSSNFTVLIDGKPTILEGSEALEQIPASAINNIEIITNPSAKYDPEGIAGIINIIMKKQNKGGFNGIINLSASTGNRYKSDILLNYRKEKFNIFGGFEYNKRGFTGERSLYRETYDKDNDNTSYILTDGDRERFHGGYKAKGGFDLYLNNKNTISISGEYGIRDLKGSALSTNKIYTIPATTSSFYITDNSKEKDRSFYTVNFNYSLKFNEGGHELLSSIYYSDNSGNENKEDNQYITDDNFIRTTDLASRQLSLEESKNNSIRAKLDYSLPFQSGSKLEIGYQYRYDFGDADFNYKNFNNTTNTWDLDASKNSNLEFTRNIQAFYTTYSGQIVGLKYLLGARGEYTDREIKLVNTNDSYLIDRFDFFPSIHLSKQLSKNHQLQASYSRRIHRPRERYLDPFTNYIDPLNIRVGNPELKPEYIDSYELNYQFRFARSFVSFEAYYRQTNNKINRVRTLQEDNIMLHTFDNIEKDFARGIEFMANIELYKWWKINLTANFFNYQIKGEVLDTDVNQATNTWNTRMSMTFKLPWQTRLQFMGFYAGPSVTAQGDRDEFMFTSVALRKEFFKRRASISLSARDIFGSMKFRFNSSTPDYMVRYEFTRESPIFTINLSYKINNYKKKRGKREGMDNDINGGGDDI